LNSGHKSCFLGEFLSAPIHPPLVACPVLQDSKMVHQKNLKLKSDSDINALTLTTYLPPYFNQEANTGVALVLPLLHWQNGGKPRTTKICVLSDSVKAAGNGANKVERDTRTNMSQQRPKLGHNCSCRWPNLKL